MVVFIDPGWVPENWRHASEEDGGMGTAVLQIV
jgi:hypothetical protein